MSKRMRILIAYDGSESSDAAIDDLRLAGFKSGVLKRPIIVLFNKPHSQPRNVIAIIPLPIDYLCNGSSYHIQIDCDFRADKA
jgi:hypothetical protein